MLFKILFSLISLAANACMYYFLGTMYSWWYLFLLPVSLPLGYVLAFGVWCLIIILWSFLIPVKKKNPKPHKVNLFYLRIVQQTVCAMFPVLNLSVKVTGEEKLPKEHYVIVTNHVSSFDQMAMLAKLRFPMIAVSKPENLYIPFAGPFLYKAGFIPINRENVLEAAKSIRQASNVVKNDIADVVICPEGTRNKTDKPLLEFHAGSFKIPIIANKPLVIMAIRNTKHAAKRIPFRHTTIYLDVLKVYQKEDYASKTSVDLRDEAMALILDDLEKHASDKK